MKDMITGDGYEIKICIVGRCDLKISLGQRSFNPLKPSIKLQILLLCFHTFLTEVVGSC